MLYTLFFFVFLSKKNDYPKKYVFLFIVVDFSFVVKTKLQLLLRNCGILE